MRSGDKEMAGLLPKAVALVSRTCMHWPFLNFLHHLCHHLLHRNNKKALLLGRLKKLNAHTASCPHA